MTRIAVRVALLLALVTAGTTAARSAGTEADPLASWNDGAAKRAICEFVRITTNRASPQYVPPGDRIATFDQDGTLWVSHPIYVQVTFAFDRVIELAPQHPEWKTTEPFRSIIRHDKAAVARLTTKDLEMIVTATHTGMTVESFQAAARQWIVKARHPRWNRLYTELIYQPMIEVMRYLRANGYRTYIVTGGGQDFVRTYAQQIYHIPPEQIIGSALKTEYEYDKSGRGILMRSPQLLLDNNLSGKPEDIHLLTGRRPQAAFGNSTGDQQMLEYAQGGGGARLAMIVMHDDPVREYAYGPANGLPETKIGTLSQALYDEARSSGWVVVSMRNDWRRIFVFE